jgi:hypothetical protein
MTSESTHRTLNWKELYELAILEPDPGKLSNRVIDARQAIYSRIKATLTKPRNAEHEQMNDALHGLRTLQQEYERRLQQFGE